MPHVDLLELPYFEGISMDGLVSLVDLMEPCQFEPDQVVMAEGQPGPHPLYIATLGRLLVTKRDPDHKEVSLAELTAPTLFGEIELFCQLPAVCSTRALDRVAAFSLSQQTFDSLFQAKNPALLRFTFNVARVACHRLAIADELLTQALHGEDLIALRQAVWTRMSADGQWKQTTGAFSRKDLAQS